MYICQWWQMIVKTERRILEIRKRGRLILFDLNGERRRNWN
ncbi:MAG: hypothetical protein ACTS4Z_01535 [Candidatus Hodgkinia cicadicola]